MKKILLTAAAIASMLFAASCQKENFSARQEGDVVTATLTVQAPGQPGTKVIGDGMTADNLVFAVFDETGAELPELRQGDWTKGQEEITFGGDLQTTVTVKLVRGKEYTFVCWAQNETATCYDFEDMKNIGISYDGLAQDETRDAFYASVQTGKITENFSKTIVLNRPFAQINVGTTDLIEAQKAGLEIDNLYTTMTVKNAATVLNTFTGAASAAEEVTFAYAHTVAPVEKLIINKDKVVNNPTIAIADEYGWLAMNYILVADGTVNGASSALAEVSFAIRENDATVLTSYDVPNVPVQRNYRTNIVGGLLTADGEISIIIDPVFNGEYVVDGNPLYIPATVAEFIAAAENDVVYQLTGQITSVTNTTYGNFYLKDATGEVLIYGLCSPAGAQKYWAESGAKPGDTITVQTVRSSYNGTPQGRDAKFVELVPFVAQASEWGVVGDLTSWGTSDIKMVTTWHTKNLFVAYNVEIASGSFKIRANNQWNDAKNYGFEVAGSAKADNYYAVITRGDSQNITPMVYGKYDVYFDLTNKRVALMTPGKEYAEAKDGGKPIVVVAGLKDHEWGVVGSFNDWNVANYVVTEVDGDWAVAKNVTLAKNAEFKFAADKAWTLSYGSACNVNVGKTYTTYNNGGNMKFVGEAGAYDIYFSLTTADFYMEKAVVVEPSEPSEPVTESSTLTFDDTAKRTTFSTSQQIWQENGVTLTNDKAASTNAVADYAKPARFYQGSKITVAVDGKISEIVFDCNSSTYANDLKTSIGTTATASVASDKVTVTLDGTSSEFVVAKLAKQVRMDSITVTYTK